MTNQSITLDTLYSKLIDIETRLHVIEQQTRRMDHHVSFVNSVYDVIRIPFMHALNWFQWPAMELPESQSSQLAIDNLLEQ